MADLDQVMDDDRHPWGIWIDIEGFGNLWSAGDLALRGLTHLTRLVFSLGSTCFPHAPDRLFAHQVGDAFYIASDFHEESLDRCVAIAVALMRGMTGIGCVARASIAEGALADYAGCRPPEVQAHAARGGDTDVVRLGEGIMTLQAAMGQGMINAHVLDKSSGTKGAILTIAADDTARLSPGFLTRNLDGADGISAIDWVHSTSPLIDEISAKAGFGGDDPRELALRLRAYVENHGMKREWSEPTLRYAGLA